MPNNKQDHIGVSKLSYSRKRTLVKQKGWTRKQKLWTTFFVILWIVYLIIGGYNPNLALWYIVQSLLPK